MQILSFLYIAYPLPVLVRGICVFDNFEKLLMLLGLSRDILEGWARGCCVHVFLVLNIFFLLSSELAGNEISLNIYGKPNIIGAEGKFKLGMKRFQGEYPIQSGHCI